MYPEGFENLPYLYPGDINFHVMVAVVIALLLVGINFLLQAKRITDLPSQRWLFFGFGFFTFFLGIGRIFILLAYNLGRIPPHTLFDPLDCTQNVISQVSIIPAIWAFEKYIIPQTKHIFTVLAFIVVGMSMVPLLLNSYNEDILLGQRIGVAPLFVVVAIMFIFLIRRTSGDVRKRSIEMLVALATMVAGMLLDNNTVIRMQILPLWLAPTIYLVGVLIFGFSARISRR